MTDKNFDLTPDANRKTSATKYQRGMITQLAATLQDAAEELSKLNNIRGDNLETASYLVMEAEKALAIFKKNCLDKP